jgi:mannose/fructose/N-acetylgalactosamine-specific phosphotransferase system component IIC
VSFPDALFIALLGGLLGLDTVSFPQAMLSRPIVAGTLGGALVGHPAHGLLLGATLELFALETLPFGASRYPEWGSSSVVGGALFAGLPLSMPGGLATSVLAALVTAWVGGLSMVRVRKLNAHWARARHGQVSLGDRQVVIGLQLAGLTADFLRGLALTVAALLALAPLQQAVLGSWTGGAELSRAVVAALAATVSLGAAYKLFHAWQFLLGLSAGLVAAVIT